VHQAANRQEFFLVSLIRKKSKNPFLSSTKQVWLGGCECPLAPPLATLLTPRVEREPLNNCFCFFHNLLTRFLSYQAKKDLFKCIQHFTLKEMSLINIRHYNI
jgi:hypothetical protein